MCISLRQIIPINDMREIRRIPDWEIRHIKAILLYILNNMPSDLHDVYYIVKTAFYAQKKHIVKWGIPMFRDDIVALPFGPVPSLVYDILHVSRGQREAYKYCDDRALDIISMSIDFKNEYYSANQSPDMDCLSQSNVECLDEAIAEVSHMNFGEIMSKTHGAEWARAYRNASNHKMDYVNIAKEGGASEEILDYLSQSLELDTYLG